MSGEKITQAVSTTTRPGVANVHFSSKSDLWSTPTWLFKELDTEFGFTVDVCATAENAKCTRYFTPQTDGLKQDWQGVCWMNPPYGRQIQHWVRKAYFSCLAGATVVCLLPARTDTAWWHTYVKQASEIRFLRGRLKFGNSRHSAPFPSAVVVFRQPRQQHKRPTPAADGSTLFDGYADQ